MLAILIIAHPDDNKFKDRIVKRLQIDWMITQDPETLDVRHGFWAGLNSRNLHQVFLPEEEREAQTELLADYNVLFGGAFVRAKTDIKPFLQEWARDQLQLNNPAGTDPGKILPDESSTSDSPSLHAPNSTNSTDPNTHDTTATATPAPVACETSDESYAGTGFSARDVRQLRTCLVPENHGVTTEAELARLEEESRQLARWLSGRLGSTEVATKDKPLLKWRKHWVKEIEGSKTYQDQVVVQSLFLQSARQLQHLSKTPIAAVAAAAAAQHPKDPGFSAPLEHLYMVLDLYDSKRRPVREESVQTVLQFLRRVHAYGALDEANSRLTRLVRADRAGLLQELLNAQMGALSHIPTSEFPDYFYGAIALETLRTLTLIQGAEEPPQEQQQIWCDHEDHRLSQGAAATDWQRRALLLPGGYQVLTYCQELVFRTRFCPGTGWKDMDTVDLEKLAPLELGGSLHDASEETLYKLFVGVSKPERLPSVPGLLTPVLTSPAATPNTMTPEQASTPMVPITGPAATSPTAPAAAVIPSGTPSHATDASATSTGSLAGRTARSTWNAAAGHPHTHVTRSPETPARRTPSQPPAGRNAFSGQIFSPAKRAGSPFGSRQAKVPKLGFRGGLEDLREDVRESVDELKADFRAEREKLCEDLHQELRASEQRAASEISSMKTDVALLKAELKAEQGARGRESEAREKQLTEIRDLADQHHDEAQGSVISLQKVIEDVSTGLGTLRDLVMNPPQPPPEEGCLARECPAPEGQDQKAYESRLFRACLSYVYILWDPFSDEGGGVGQDYRALDETKGRFPDLEEAALVKALEHFHGLVFNRPLRRTEG